MNSAQIAHKEKQLDLRRWKCPTQGRLDGPANDFVSLTAVGHFQRPIERGWLTIRRYCVPAVTRKLGTFSALNLFTCCFVLRIAWQQSKVKTSHLSLIVLCNLDIISRVANKNDRLFMPHKLQNLYLRRWKCRISCNRGCAAPADHPHLPLHCGRWKCPTAAKDKIYLSITHTLLCRHFKRPLSGLDLFIRVVH